VRHRKAGRKLGRDSAHRDALYANLASALIEHGRIKTTEAKAKEVRPIVEEMITLGKRGDVAAHRYAVPVLRSKSAAHTLFAEVARALPSGPAAVRGS
jgi:large subunit ribosomal protein L17